MFSFMLHCQMENHNKLMFLANGQGKRNTQWLVEKCDHKYTNGHVISYGNKDYHFLKYYFVTIMNLYVLYENLMSFYLFIA